MVMQLGDGFKVTDKRIISAVQSVTDPELLSAILGTKRTLCTFSFLREKEAAFRALLPKYFDAMLAEHDNTYSEYSFLKRYKLLTYLCLERGVVDPCDLTSVKKFDAVGIKPSELYSDAPSSVVFKQGLSRRKFTDADVVRFVEKEPDYLQYFLPLMIAVDSEVFEAAICGYLRNAGLQDTQRFIVLKEIMLSHNAAALIRLTDMIDANNFYRLRAFNDVATTVGYYEAILPPKDLVAVIRSAAKGEIDKCMTAEYRHAWNFIVAYDRMFHDKFDAFACDVFARGGNRARQALLRALKADSINVKYAAHIFNDRLTVEDVSFCYYDINGKVIPDAVVPAAFKCLYDMALGMDKVSYHFKTDDDVTFARDVEKSRIVSILAQLARRQKGNGYAVRLDALFDTFREKAQAEYLDEIGDKTKINVRAAAIAFLKTDNYTALKFYDKQGIKLTYDEAVAVSDYLKTKKQSVKTKIIKEFLRSDQKEKIADYLVGCAESYKKEAGEEMKSSLGKVSAKKLAAPTRLFGWDEKSVFEVKAPTAEINKILSQKFARGKIKSMKLARFKEFWNKLLDFRAQNADYEYDTGYQVTTLGAHFSTVKHDDASPRASFSHYPLGDGFKSIFAELSSDELGFIAVLVRCVDSGNKKLFTALADGGEAKKMYAVLEVLDRSYFSQSPFGMLRSLCGAAVNELVDADTLRDIIYAYTQKSAISTMLHKHDNYYRGTDLPDLFEYALAERGDSEDDIRLRLFATCTFMKAGLRENPSMQLTAAAYEKGIVSVEFARYFIYKNNNLGGAFDGDHKGNVMRPGYPYKKFRQCLLEFADDIVMNEFKRGSLQTPYSSMIAHCGKFFGIKYYVMAVAALRGLTWARSGYNYDKNVVFSAILKHTVRGDDDGYALFVSLVEQYKLTEDELIRATLFNPEFVDYTAEYLKIPGLKTAVFWFYAHLNETLFGDEKDKREQQIKEFSDISYPDFQDGAFDCKWYNEMVNTLPQKMLKRIYDNAKYVTVGGLHKRAQRFFDAVNGKISKDECLEKIHGTRNKDYCLIYSLIPVESKADLYERYEILSEFVRTGKQFGAQRQASERRTVDIAFDNLARAAGYGDSDVFVFEMESQNPSDIYKPYEIGDVTVTPYIDEKALKIAYNVFKDGKKLASVPAKYGKDKMLVALRDEIKTLNKKFARVKASLEKCMVNSVVFTAEQIRTMCRERIISAVLGKLLFMADGGICVCKDGEFFDLSGNAVSPQSVVVAHAVTLKKAGLLAAAVDYVVKNNIRQPFKQALREIYTKSYEELNASEVLRFKGYNVDLKKCVAALKGKGWGVSEDIGLRRVFYKTDTVAAIFREFDGFYIADYEDVDRELHGVFFYKRKSGEVIELKDVDDVTFSETLRDVDLMITISSNVVYDFELAKSTAEIRREILRSVADILKLNNVTFLKDNIKVEGHYGNYVINIRTGLVFKEGKGNLMLDTVYSANKPLLLDFIDEDPMSVDIISKAVVLSDDKRITDPAILREIKD